MTCRCVNGYVCIACKRARDAHIRNRAEAPAEFVDPRKSAIAEWVQRHGFTWTFAAEAYADAKIAFRGVAESRGEKIYAAAQTTLSKQLYYWKIERDLRQSSQAGTRTTRVKKFRDVWDDGKREISFKRKPQLIWRRNESTRKR